ncbi:hypothetical protein BJX99DRAFT_255324 [Aspergillus californicus]
MPSSACGFRIDSLAYMSAASLLLLNRLGQAKPSITRTWLGSLEIFLCLTIRLAELRFQNCPYHAEPLEKCSYLLLPMLEVRLHEFITNFGLLTPTTEGLAHILRRVIGIGTVAAGILMRDMRYMSFGLVYPCYVESPFVYDASTNSLDA